MSSTPSPPSTGARPWQQFLDLSALSFPVSFSESTYRLTHNLRHFLSNYTLLTLLVFLVSLLTRPLSLLLFLCISTAWIYFFSSSREDSLTLFDHNIDPKIVTAILGVLTLGALFWTKVWFSLFVSLVIGAVIVFVHAVLRAPEDSLEDSPYGSLLNVVDSPRGDYSSV